MVYKSSTFNLKSLLKKYVKPAYSSLIMKGLVNYGLPPAPDDADNVAALYQLRQKMLDL